MHQACRMLRILHHKPRSGCIYTDFLHLWMEGCPCQGCTSSRPLGVCKVKESENYLQRKKSQKSPSRPLGASGWTVAAYSGSGLHMAGTEGKEKLTIDHGDLCRNLCCERCKGSVPYKQSLSDGCCFGMCSLVHQPYQTSHLRGAPVASIINECEICGTI